MTCQIKYLAFSKYVENRQVVFLFKILLYSLHKRYIFYKIVFQLFSCLFKVQPFLNEKNFFYFFRASDRNNFFIFGISIPESSKKISINVGGLGSDKIRKNTFWVYSMFGRVEKADSKKKLFRYNELRQNRNFFRFKH